MLGFLEKLKTKRQTEVVIDAQTYRRLIHKAAGSGDLSASDTDIIERTAKALDIPLSKIEQDIQVVRQAREIGATVASYEDLKKQHKESGRAVNDAVVEWGRIQAEFTQRLEGLQSERARLGIKREATGKAAQQLNAMRAAHPALFGTLGEEGYGGAGKP